MVGNELVFYTNPMSRGRVIRWMLEEIGCAYETVVLDYGTTMKAPDYLAINPMGKVPAIKHRERNRYGNGSNHCLPCRCVSRSKPSASCR